VGRGGWGERLRREGGRESSGNFLAAVSAAKGLAKTAQTCGRRRGEQQPRASPRRAAGCPAAAAGCAAAPCDRWRTTRLSVAFPTRAPLQLAPAALRPVAVRHWSQEWGSPPRDLPLRPGAAHMFDKREPDTATMQMMALAREGAKYGVMVVAAGAMLTVKKPTGK